MWQHRSESTPHPCYPGSFPPLPPQPAASTLGARRPQRGRRWDGLRNVDSRRPRRRELRVPGPCQVLAPCSGSKGRCSPSWPGCLGTGLARRTCRLRRSRPSKESTVTALEGTNTSAEKSHIKGNASGEPGSTHRKAPPLPHTKRQSASQQTLLLRQHKFKVTGFASAPFS